MIQLWEHTLPCRQQHCTDTDAEYVAWLELEFPGGRDHYYSMAICSIWVQSGTTQNPYYNGLKCWSQVTDRTHLIPAIDATIRALDELEWY